jgi:hypothetical protein
MSHVGAATKPNGVVDRIDADVSSGATVVGSLTAAAAG